MISSNSCVLKCQSLEGIWVDVCGHMLKIAWWDWTVKQTTVSCFTVGNLNRIPNISTTTNEHSMISMGSWHIMTNGHMLSWLVEPTAKYQPFLDGSCYGSCSPGIEPQLLKRPFHQCFDWRPEWPGDIKQRDSEYSVHTPVYLVYNIYIIYNYIDVYIWLCSTIVAWLHSSSLITIPYPYPYPSLCCIFTGKDRCWFCAAEQLSARVFHWGFSSCFRPFSSAGLVDQKLLDLEGYRVNIHKTYSPDSPELWAGKGPQSLVVFSSKHLIFSGLHPHLRSHVQLVEWTCLLTVLSISMWSKWSISSGWLVKYQLLLDFSSETCIWRETILSWRFSTNPTKFSDDKTTHIFGCVRKL